jgi:hypothetical protein
MSMNLYSAIIYGLTELCYQSSVSQSEGIYDVLLGVCWTGLVANLA